MQRAGVPVDTFMAILRESALFAPVFEKKLPRLLTRDYQNPNFSTRHLLKDVELFLKEASGYALTTSGLEGIRPVLERTIAQGLGDFRLFGHLRGRQPDSIASPSLQACCRLPRPIGSRGSRSFSILVVRDENTSILTVVATGQQCTQTDIVFPP